MKLLKDHVTYLCIQPCEDSVSCDSSHDVCVGDSDSPDRNRRCVPNVCFSATLRRTHAEFDYELEYYPVNRPLLFRCKKGYAASSVLQGNWYTSCSPLPPGTSLTRTTSRGLPSAPRPSSATTTAAGGCRRGWGGCRSASRDA